MEAQTSTQPDHKAKKQLGLDWTDAERDAYIRNIKVVDLPRLEEPYPINNFFTAGTPKAKEDWEAYWHGKPLADPRYNHGLRREIVNLDKSKLQYIIPQDESVIFRDAYTKELVLVVLRNFIPDENVRKSMVEVCREILKYRRDDRREDPGMLVHFGYTCGSRHAPNIQLAKPCVSMRTYEQQERERKMNIKAQGMAGIIWNLMRSRLPPEIIASYNDLIRDYDLPRMDMMRDDDDFSFKVGGKEVTFKDLELPPPSGCSAINYARYTHKENNFNNWILACTCEAPKDPSKGGNFYLASYGIMMSPASATLSAWHPTDYHGTTLYEMIEGPEKRAGFETRPDGDINTGMVFELSKAIKNARLNSTWLDERRGSKKVKRLGPARVSKQTRYGLRPRTADTDRA